MVGPITILQRQAPGDTWQGSNGHPTPREGVEPGAVTRRPSDANRVPDGTALPLSYGSTRALERRFAVLRNAAARVFQRQGLHGAIANGSESVSVPTPSRAQARSAVGSDGHLGVSRVTDELVRLALQAAGPTPAGVERARSALEQGFEMALAAFDGALPDLTHKTLDAALVEMDRVFAARLTLDESDGR